VRASTSGQVPTRYCLLELLETQEANRIEARHRIKASIDEEKALA